MKILVTGATGYIGGRLVAHLLARGHAIRCLARDPARLQGRRWLEQVEVVGGEAGWLMLHCSLHARLWRGGCGRARGASWTTDPPFREPQAGIADSERRTAPARTQTRARARGGICN